MLTRRQFLERSLQGSSLVAASAVLPSFIARTAMAAEPGGENILVVVEMTGGNDGLNTVIPYGDDLYHKARPTLHYSGDEVLKVDDHIGLHPSLSGLSNLLQQDSLAIVQGVGYPNPNRSHFESMDIWQSADVKNKLRSGWLGRSLADIKTQPGHIAAFHLGSEQLPLAMKGSSIGVPSLNAEKPFGLSLGATDEDDASRSTLGPEGKRNDPYADHRTLVRSMAKPNSGGTQNSILQFVQQTSIETYKTVDRLQEILSADFDLPEGEYEFKGGDYRQSRSGLPYQLRLVARMIQSGFGTRIFYVSLAGFDTHSDQRQEHANLLAQLGSAVELFFSELDEDNQKRVLLMTYSEFGRRVHENGSKGTDHGAAGGMFVAGPSVKSGLLGEHPSLAADKLDSGDLAYGLDFRRVYATLLDRWLDCDSRAVLMDKFEHVPLI
jgi:uncharacterized protein (DUF1501 family)